MSADEWTSDDLYRARPEVPGHAMKTSAEGRNFIITCECGWTSKPLHLSNLTAAENRHRIEVTP